MSNLDSKCENFFLLFTIKLLNTSFRI